MALASAEQKAFEADLIQLKSYMAFDDIQDLQPGEEKVLQE